MLAGGIAAAAVNASPLGGAALAGTIWYGGEALLAYAARWPLSLHSPLTWLLRDALLIPLWVAGWFGNDIVWRGNQMDLAEDVLLGAAAERE